MELTEAKVSKKYFGTTNIDTQLNERLVYTASKDRYSILEWLETNKVLFPT